MLLSLSSSVRCLLRRGSGAALLLVGLLFCASALQAAKNWPLGIKHVGAVYLEADEGDLEIEVFKKDSADFPQSQRMRLFLAAPDGSIVDEFVLPSHDFSEGRNAGAWGPTQSHTLRAKVDEPGVYTLLVTFEVYRYGEGAVWGFNTNAGRYMLDAGGGHKDDLRNERIMLDNPGVKGEICFVPQQGTFRIELTGLPQDVTALTLLDADDQLVRELAVRDGKVTETIAASAGNRDGVWRLLLPSQQVVAQIEGVTTWKTAEVGNRQMALWTTSRDQYFDLQSRYWLLRPRNLTRVVEQDKGAGVEYTVYNSGNEPIEVSIEASTPEFSEWVQKALALKVSRDVFRLEPEQKQQFTLSYDASKVPADGVQVRVYATARAQGTGDVFKTYATLNLTHEAPERKGVTPLQLKPWAHEAQLFGYQPNYPTGGEPHFAPDNTAWVIADQKIWYSKPDGQWQAIEGIPEIVSQRHGGGKWIYYDTVTGFDNEGATYFTLRKGAEVVLVRLSDKGETVHTVQLPGNQMSGVYMERPSLFAKTDGLPLIHRTIRTADRPRVPGQRWGRNHRLEILVPQFADGELTIGEPIVVTEICVGAGNHSGAPNPVISNGDKIHVTWGETSGAEQKHRGVPTYAASWDRSGKRLSDPVLLGYAPPVNDGHNSPGMVMDSKGILHTVLGSHNQSFQYVRALEPDSTAAWTNAVAVAPRHSQSYVGLVIDRNDTLHLVYREWRRSPAFPDVFDASLFYQRKEPDGNWTRPEPLILPPLPHYSVWYHKLTNDRLGRLFLSYDYWSTWMAYRAAEDRESMSKWKGMGRTLLLSEDGGRQWLLAEDADFVKP